MECVHILYIYMTGTFLQPGDWILTARVEREKETETEEDKVRDGIRVTWKQREADTRSSFYDLTLEVI